MSRPKTVLDLRGIKLKNQGDRGRKNSQNRVPERKELYREKTLEICRVSPLSPQLGTDNYMCSMKRL